ncbi:DNA recombination and repair protein RecA, partial [Cynara cardunculus var. scolymus]
MQGRVVEIYGPEASGKTTLALHVIAEAQKQGDYNKVAAMSLKAVNENFGFGGESPVGGNWYGAKCQPNSFICRGASTGCRRMEI